MGILHDLKFDLNYFGCRYVLNRAKSGIIDYINRYSEHYDEFGSEAVISDSEFGDDHDGVDDFYSAENNNLSRIIMPGSYDGLNIFTEARARDINMLVSLLILRGKIDPDNLDGHVVDFGMGTGPGSYILSQYGADITGVDISESGVRAAIDEGILPEDRALVIDGFDYLSGLEGNSLDLIAAFMVESGFPYKILYDESKRVLKPGGQLLITGGQYELENELFRKVGQYGDIERVITINSQSDFSHHVAFIYRK